MAPIEGFEWDPQKAARNLVKHGVDFEDAIQIFSGPLLLRRSDRIHEKRWLAIGEVHGRLIAVAFTWRGRMLRIISARRARKNEKRSFHQEKMGRLAEGQD